MDGADGVDDSDSTAVENQACLDFGFELLLNDVAVAVAADAEVMN